MAFVVFLPSSSLSASSRLPKGFDAAVESIIKANKAGPVVLAFISFSRTNTYLNNNGTTDEAATEGTNASS